MYQIHRPVQCTMLIPYSDLENMVRDTKSTMRRKAGSCDGLDSMQESVSRLPVLNIGKKDPEIGFLYTEISVDDLYKDCLYLKEARRTLTEVPCMKKCTWTGYRDRGRGWRSGHKHGLFYVLVDEQ